MTFFRHRFQMVPFSSIYFRNRAFSKGSTLESVLENLRFHQHFLVVLAGTIDENASKSVRFHTRTRRCGRGLKVSVLRAYKPK